MNIYNKVKTNIEELKVLEEFAREGECTEKEIDTQYKRTIQSLEDLEFKNKNIESNVRNKRSNIFEFEKFVVRSLRNLQKH